MHLDPYKITAGLRTSPNEMLLKPSTKANHKTTVWKGVWAKGETG